MSTLFRGNLTTAGCGGKKKNAAQLDGVLEKTGKISALAELGSAACSLEAVLCLHGSRKPLRHNGLRISETSIASVSNH